MFILRAHDANSNTRLTFLKLFHDFLNLNIIPRYRPPPLTVVIRLLYFHKDWSLPLILRLPSTRSLPLRLPLPRLLALCISLPRSLPLHAAIPLLRMPFSATTR